MIPGTRKCALLLIASMLAGCTGSSGPDLMGVQDYRQKALECLKRGLGYAALPSVRIQSIESLETASPSEGVPWIRIALTDEHPAARFAACMALGTLKDKGSMQSMRKLLNDPDDSVRVAAIYALHRMGDTQHSALLADYLDQNHNLPAKRNAILAFGRLGEKGAIPLLARMVNNRDEGVHAQALESLALLGHEDAMRQLAFEANSGTGPQQVFAINALALIRSEKFVPVFKSAFKTGQFPEVKLAAARALGAMGSKEGLSEAMRMIDFSSPNTKVLKDDPAENQIMRMRQMAALALGDIGDPAALPRLTERMQDNVDPRVQVAAARAILQIANHRDRQLLPFAWSGGGEP